MLGNEVWQNTMGGRTGPQRTQLDTLKRHTCAPTTAVQSKLKAETPCPLTGPMARAMSPSSCSTLAARLRLLSVMRPCRAARGSRLDGRLYHVHCRPIPRNAHMQMPCSASLGVARPVRHTTKPAQEHAPTAANQQNTACLEDGEQLAHVGLDAPGRLGQQLDHLHSSTGRHSTREISSLVTEQAAYHATQPHCCHSCTRHPSAGTMHIMACPSCTPNA